MNLSFLIKSWVGLVAMIAMAGPALAAAQSAPTPVTLKGDVMLEKSVTVSVGVAQARGAEETADGLLRAANIALHRAEAQGKNQSCLFEPWMQERASTRQASGLANSGCNSRAPKPRAANHTPLASAAPRVPGAW